MARAPADGYTLLFANEFLATNPLMFKEIRYDSLKDFVPIAKVASNAAAIAVHPSLGIKTIQELIALGRTKNLNYASPGVGTGPHLFGQLIAMQTGAKFTNIPYKLRDPELLNKLRNAGFDVEPSIGDDFGAELRADMDRWVRVIRDAKIPRE